MTQQELVIQFIKQHGSILPAKMGGRIYLGEMFGSETGRRCRNLRNKGILRSQQEGRFERFFLVDVPVRSYRVVDELGRVEKIIKF